MVSLEPSWGTSCHCSKAQQLLSPRCKQPSRRSNRRGAKRATPSGWAATTAVAAACRFSDAWHNLLNSENTRLSAVAGVPFQHHAITHAYGTVKGHSIELHTLQMAAERLRALTEDMKTAERSAAPQPTEAPGGRRRRASSPKCDFSTQALLGLFSKWGPGWRTVSAHHSVFAGVILKAGALS